MVQIETPFCSSTKYYHKYELKNGKYIVSIYLPISDFPDKPDKVTVTA